MGKKINNIFKGDKVIWMVFFLLCMISIVEVFSASSELTYKNGNIATPILYHAGILLAGTIVVIITHNIQCRYFKLLTPILLLVSFSTLVWALAAGHSTNGAQRWVSLLGIQFQPSEIAKGTMILATAQILGAMQTKDGADKRAFGWIIGICCCIVPLIMLENLSTAMLLSFVILLMMFIGRVPMVQLGKLLGITMMAIIAVVALIMITGDDSKEDSRYQMSEQIEQPAEKKSSVSKIFHRMGTWKGRIKTFTSNNDTLPDEYYLIGKGAQAGHANIAIASCNIIGKGPGNSKERDYLPQAFSDFIFSIIIEEMGIEGGIIVVFLYIVLLFRTARIASRCERNFPAMLIMGLALLLVTQAIFNMLVAVGLAPVTGQPLPLISKGGTSTLINCAYIGAILSVSRYAKKKPEEDMNDTNKIIEPKSSDTNYSEEFTK